MKLLRLFLNILVILLFGLILEYSYSSVFNKLEIGYEGASKESSKVAESKEKEKTNILEKFWEFLQPFLLVGTGVFFGKIASNIADSIYSSIAGILTSFFKTTSKKYKRK
jgi:hypothetical protein